MAVRAYRGTAWVIQHVPESLARAVIGTLTQASYLAWPQKRRWSNANFGHVLGRDPGDAEVRRLALAAYRTYARYLVELMRLPGLAPREGRRPRRAGRDREGARDLERLRRAHPRRRSRRQQRGHRGGTRVTGLAGQRRRRRHVVSGAVRPAAPSAGGLGHQAHPVAKPTSDLRGPAARRDAGPARRLGLPAGRDPGSSLQRLDDAAGGPGRPRGEDRRDHPADRDPPNARRPILDGHRGADPRRFEQAGRHPAGDPGRRRRAHSNDRSGAGAVVQLQADVARDGRRRGASSRGGPSIPRPPVWTSRRRVRPASGRSSRKSDCRDRRAGRSPRRERGDDHPAGSRPRDRRALVAPLPAAGGARSSGWPRSAAWCAPDLRSGRGPRCG